jgi:hypothetical protein
VLQYVAKPFGPVGQHCAVLVQAELTAAHPVVQVFVAGEQYEPEQQSASEAQPVPAFAQHAQVVFDGHALPVEVMQLNPVQQPGMFVVEVLVSHAPFRLAQVAGGASQVQPVPEQARPPESWQVRRGGTSVESQQSPFVAQDWPVSEHVGPTTVPQVPLVWPAWTLQT